MIFRPDADYVILQRFDLKLSLPVIQGGKGRRRFRTSVTRGKAFSSECLQMELHESESKRTDGGTTVLEYSTPTSGSFLSRQLSKNVWQFCLCFLKS